MIAAQNNGAEGGVLGLPGNVASQVIDAADSLSSPLKLSSSWGTFTQKGVTDLPELSRRTWPSPTRSARRRQLAPVADLQRDHRRLQAVRQGRPRSRIDHRSGHQRVAVGVLARQGDARRKGNRHHSRHRQGGLRRRRRTFRCSTSCHRGRRRSSRPTRSSRESRTRCTGPGHWDSSTSEFVVDDKQVDILALLG